jgi:hypothetical protein
VTNLRRLNVATGGFRPEHKLRSADYGYILAGQH